MNEFGARIVSYTDLRGGPGGHDYGILLNSDQCVYWREGWDAQYTMTELLALAYMIQLGWL